MLYSRVAERQQKQNIRPVYDLNQDRERERGTITGIEGYRVSYCSSVELSALFNFINLSEAL